MALKDDLERLIDENGFEAVFAVVSHADIVDDVQGLLQKYGWSEVAEQLNKLQPKKLRQSHPDDDPEMLEPRL